MQENSDIELTDDELMQLKDQFREQQKRIYPVDAVRRTRHPGSKNKSTKNARRASAKRAKMARRINR